VKFDLHPARDHVQDRSHLGISDAEIADLVCAYRLYGFFRQELDTGRCYYSEQACRIYGIDYTGEPVDIPALVRMTHPDDLELVAHTFETAAARKAGFHLIHRQKRPGGEWHFLRLVARYRDGEVAGGELVGMVYEFYDHLHVAGIAPAA
jgi:hypothetical protein